MDSDSDALSIPASWVHMESSTAFYDYHDKLSLLCESNAIFFSTISTVILYSLVFLLSLVGNSLVLWVLVKYENLESLTNIFILNLCLSDLMFSCLLPVLISAQWDWFLGDFFCKFFNMIFCISLYSSIFFLTIMTIHRYLSVVSPISTLGIHTLRCRVLVTTSVWAASILSSIPDAVFHKVISLHCDYSEFHGFLASVYQHNIFFLLSMGIILFCYIQILRTLFRSRSRQRHRTVRLIFTVVVAYFLSWAPYNLILFLKTGIIQQSCESRQQLDIAMIISRNLAFSHCCFNPVLYVFVGVKFRRHLKRLLQQVWLCRKTSSTVPFSCSPGTFTYEGPSFY
ncbi:chemokine XC receptor 1 [Mastomys coucha]|uniref:chemokine XC receptor 1 n=1 Tax=Mastomys coucha TaxID=35658 RepID=UPI0012626D60|nr:chemokine XC receptor 1 [Mastomys coucha]